MGNETAGANNPNNATGSTEAPVTSLATATDETGKQTPNADAQKPPVSETSEQKSPAQQSEEKPPAQQQSAPVVPEKYDFKAPEGMEFDAAVLETYSDAAKAAGLSQEAAQKVIEKMAPAIAQCQLDQMNALHKEWTDASTADKEFGGEKLKENLGVVRKALDTFDPLPQGATTTPLRTLLNTTGMGNHPEIIRVLYRAGKAISEDHFVGGSSAKNAPRTLAERLYGEQK